MQNLNKTYCSINKIPMSLLILTKHGLHSIIYVFITGLSMGGDENAIAPRKYQ